MYCGVVLDLKILGFLNEGPLHGYELRRRIGELDGPGRPVSEGSLYPALARLERSGFVRRSQEPGARGRMRRRVEITPAGRERLHDLLRHPTEAEMSHLPHFLIVLAFLSQLPDPAERRAVLRRRLAILEAPAPSFFFNDDGTARRASAEPDPYRRGMARIAGASRRAEIVWLRQTLDHEPTPPQPPALQAQPPALQGTPPDTPSHTGRPQLQESL